MTSKSEADIERKRVKKINKDERREQGDMEVVKLLNSEDLILSSEVEPDLHEGCPFKQHKGMCLLVRLDY